MSLFVISRQDVGKGMSALCANFLNTFVLSPLTENTSSVGTHAGGFLIGVPLSAQALGVSADASVVAARRVGEGDG